MWEFIIKAPNSRCSEPKHYLELISLRSEPASKRANFLIYHSMQKASWLFKKLVRYFWRFINLFAFSDPENM